MRTKTLRRRACCWRVTTSANLGDMERGFQDNERPIRNRIDFA